VKPKDLLNSYIESYLVDELQKYGFRYSKNAPKVSRSNGEFELTISFSLSKWNSEDNCEFWTMWGVTSKKYAKWYKEEWGTKPVNHAIVGDAEWNIPGWTREPYKHFKLTNSEADKAEFNEFIQNVLNVGIPYYSNITDWNIAAEYAAARESMVFYFKVCDFYLISGQKQKAKDILELGQKEIEKRKQDQYFQLPEIQKRLDRYFN
jgi:hypothetical protein